MSTVDAPAREKVKQSSKKAPKADVALEEHKNQILEKLAKERERQLDELAERLNIERAVLEGRSPEREKLLKEYWEIEDKQIEQQRGKPSTDVSPRYVVLPPDGGGGHYHVAGYAGYSYCYRADEGWASNVYASTDPANNIMHFDMSTAGGSCTLIGARTAEAKLWFYFLPLETGIVNAHAYYEPYGKYKLLADYTPFCHKYANANVTSSIKLMWGMSKDRAEWSVTPTQVTVMNTTAWDPPGLSGAVPAPAPLQSNPINVNSLGYYVIAEVYVKASVKACGSGSTALLDLSAADYLKIPKIRFYLAR